MSDNLKLTIDCQCGNSESVEIVSAQADAIEDVAVRQGWYEADDKWWCSFGCSFEDMNVANDESECLTDWERTDASKL